MATRRSWYETIISIVPKEYIRSWQQDMFVAVTDEVEEIARDARLHGDVGAYTDKHGCLWYIFYDAFTPWYDKVKAVSRAGKNPVLTMKMRYREEAFRDGSYYRAMEAI